MAKQDWKKSKFNPWATWGWFFIYLFFEVERFLFYCGNVCEDQILFS